MICLRNSARICAAVGPEGGEPAGGVPPPPGGGAPCVALTSATA
jgi:hypothetical protein